MIIWILCQVFFVFTKTETHFNDKHHRGRERSVKSDRAADRNSCTCATDPETIVLSYLRQFDNKLNLIQEKLETIEQRLNNMTGETDERLPRDCSDILKRHPDSKTGIYNITTRENGDVFPVFCDMDTAGGGWTVFQKRSFYLQFFYKSWADYADGFGDASRNVWMGNDRLASLTAARQYKLRVELYDFDGVYRYAEYSLFKVSNSSDKYRLSELGSYSGNASDALSYHKDQQFSTHDQDNDAWSAGNCAVKHRGAWWYKDCLRSNLNGEFITPVSEQGMVWYDAEDVVHSIKFSVMMIRPVDFICPNGGCE